MKNNPPISSFISGISSYELTRWCRKRLAPYKVPHYIEFRDMLPRSKVGKMLRREMRAEEQRKLTSQQFRSTGVEQYDP